MIISKTPYRISFLGGGTDYPVWFNKYGGQVLSTTIDKYVYISCRYLPPFFDHSLKLVYRNQDYVKKIENIRHSSARAVLNYMNLKNNLEIHHYSDLPARSGIGSSSAFTVSLLNCLYKYKNKKISKKQLSEKSIFIEQKILGETVGSQDQISASYGGLNKIKFFKKNNFKVYKVNILKNQLKEFSENLLLFHTGIFRIANNVSKSYVNKFEKHVYYYEELFNLVNVGIKLLKNNDFDEFGKTLHQAWNLKKSISNRISNNKIDDIYYNAISSGAIGGKLLGAGGGGFILFYVPKKFQKQVVKRLEKLIHVPFNFETSGSKIIFSSKDKIFLNEEKIWKRKFINEE